MKKLPKLERLLFATRFGEMAFNCLETLFVLKAAGLKEIVLCHIISRKEVGFVPFGGYLKDRAGMLREQAVIKFEDWQQAVSKAGIESRFVIEVGEPAPDITLAARRQQADMLVIGRGSHIGRPLAGSRTLEILRRSSIPVLVCRYLARFGTEAETAVRENRLIFEKPLLAVDWSPASETALCFLAALAGAVKKAGLVHVLEEKALLGPPADVERLRERGLSRLRRQCEALQSAGITAEAHIEAGHTAREIIETARAIGASMIMAGTTGKKKLVDFFLGSVSHKLCEISEFPVLLVPLPKREKQGSRNERPLISRGLRRS